MKQIAFRYGLMMFIGFTGFFLLMHFLRLSDNYYLRVFNGIIHLSLLWLALREWTRVHHGAVSDNASGVVVGIFTTLVGVIPFTVFMAIFLSYDSVLMAYIQSQSPIGELFTPITSSLFIFVEGLGLSLIASYLMVRVLDMMRSPS